jgi:hypothetical protein
MATLFRRRPLGKTPLRSASEAYSGSSNRFDPSQICGRRDRNRYILYLVNRILFFTLTIMVVQ